MGKNKPANVRESTFLINEVNCRQMAHMKLNLEKTMEEERSITHS